jgi:hypothetical protein
MFTYAEFQKLFREWDVAESSVRKSCAGLDGPRKREKISSGTNVRGASLALMGRRFYVLASVGNCAISALLGDRCRRGSLSFAGTCFCIAEVKTV